MECALNFGLLEISISAANKLKFLQFLTTKIFILMCCFLSMGSFSLAAGKEHLLVVLNVLQFLISSY